MMAGGIMTGVSGDPDSLQEVESYLTSAMLRELEIGKVTPTRLIEMRRT